jgi:predicted SAM-dependent methyltransferase
MLEHLDRAEARDFLAEVFRVLYPGGVVRIVVPDIARLASLYAETRDADAFVAATLLASPRPRSALAKLRALAVGAREHAWMYDGASLSRLLTDSGFEAPRVLPAGETTISDPGPLDLAERESESVYVEARRRNGKVGR